MKKIKKNTTKPTNQENKSIKQGRAIMLAIKMKETHKKNKINFLSKNQTQKEQSNQGTWSNLEEKKKIVKKKKKNMSRIKSEKPVSTLDVLKEM